MGSVRITTEQAKRFLRETGFYGWGDHVTDDRAFVLRAKAVARMIRTSAMLKAPPARKR